jgi:hypothetical protein
MALFLEIVLDPMILTILTGFLGGLVRAVVGILKWQLRAPKQKGRMNFSSAYLLASLILAGIMGTVAGVYVINDPRFSFLAGYAGTDFVEGLYKAKFQSKKKDLVADKAKV